MRGSIVGDFGSKRTIRLLILIEQIDGATVVGRQRLRPIDLGILAGIDDAHAF